MPAKYAPGNLGLAYGWVRGEDFWGGPMSENLVKLDTVINLVITSATWASPPPDAVEGSVYLVASPATGAWAGQAGRLALLVETAWRFYEPKRGWRGRLLSAGAFVWYDGTIWRDEQTGDSATDPEPPTLARFYDVGVSVGYEPDDGEMLLFLPVTNNLILPRLAAGSLFSMSGPSPGIAQLQIQRNGQRVGWINIEKGMYDGSYDVPSAVTFNIGDRVAVIAPPVQIPGFRKFGATIRFNMLGG